MTIRVEKPGILATFQDLGRFGHQRFGINPSGSMDRFASACANLLVDSPENNTVLEMHFPAPTLVFERDLVFALTGADFAPSLDGRPIQTWQSHFATAGSGLSFEQKRSGSRCYLAIAGGFEAQRWLGSSSTSLTAGIGGYQGRSLAGGDLLKARDRREIRAGLVVSPYILPKYHSYPTVRVIAGAEYGRLGAACRTAFESSGFEIEPASNRMGYRLTGPELALENHVDMVSSAVTFGTIQLLPNGQLIILMADHQTAGGYPRVANVISADLPLVAQLGPRDRVGFHVVPIQDAEEAAARRARDLRFLRVGCRLLANR